MRVYVFVLIFLVFAGCKNSTVNYNRVLDKVEQCIAQTPDSALMMLNAINMGDIDSKSTKARYALLKAIALDKNYIDATDDSLTSIAVEYYSGKRASEEKMKAYFYNGRICFNSKNYEKAMENYLIAEECVPKCKDLTYVGLLYNSKAMVYNRVYDYVKAFEQVELAASYYLKNNDTSRYLGAVNNILVNFSTRGVVEGADKYISVLEDNWEKLSVTQKSNYYSNKLAGCIKRKVKVEEIESIINLYLNDVKSETRINWVIIARSYCYLDKYDSALQSLQLYDKYNKTKPGLYYSILYKVYKNKGDYKLAMDALEKYNEYLATIALESSESDTRFLEERFVEREKQLTQRYYIALLCLALMVCLLMFLLLQRFIKNIKARHRQKELQMANEIEQYQSQYNQALIEHERLKKLLKRGKHKILIPSQIRLSLENRLNVLNAYIAANISGTYSGKASEELKKLMEDKAIFLRSMSDSFTISHPQFIEYLKSKKLNEWEIGCCCLYCIGLNGSEISSYMEQKTYYFKKISALRNKLGLDRSVNIDTFLRKVLEQINDEHKE